MATPDTGAFALPIATDPIEIEDELHAELRTRLPGWRPVPGALDTNLLAATAQVASETRGAMQETVQDELLRLLGQLFGLPRLDGTPATTTITVTANTTAGRTLPAGTPVYVGDVEMETTVPLFITDPPVGTVAVVAVDAGTAGNEATGTPELDALDWIDTVELDAPTANGTDPETPIEHSQRLARELELLTPQPILPEDAAEFALRHPGVFHAWTINLYDADTDTADQALTFTVVVTDQAGLDVSGGTLTEVRDDLQARRGTNYIIRVRNAIRVPIEVTTDFVPEDGWDPAVVAANIRSAQEDLLAPNRWVLPRYGAAPGSPPDRVVHASMLVAVSRDALGCRWIDDLTIGDGSSDRVTLDVLELPTPGDLTITEATP